MCQEEVAAIKSAADGADVHLKNGFLRDVLAKGLTSHIAWYCGHIAKPLITGFGKLARIIQSFVSSQPKTDVPEESSP